MSRRNASSQNTLLKEMVRVKKLRFRDVEKSLPRISNDVVQRSANFQEFKAVYEETFNKSQRPRNPLELQHTKSGSLCRFPRDKRQPHYIETINIELPVNYGADRAVQLIPNKIKPKRVPKLEKVNREVTTDEPKTPTSCVRASEGPLVKNEDGKAVVKDTKTLKKPSYKILPIKPLKTILKKKHDNKIMNTLFDINEKLQSMQERYFNMPRAQYKSVNDCFTQSGHVEVLYENQKYPPEVDSYVANYSLKRLSQNVLSDLKMQERIREMNERFPEFPKIEDTLKEIENHLDNIVKLEPSTKNAAIRVDFEKKEEEIKRLQDSKDAENEARRKHIMKIQEEIKKEKTRSLRYHIDEVEDFCDAMSQIANDDVDSASSDDVKFYSQERRRRASSSPKRRSPRTHLNNEAADLEISIKKSDFLSKEFLDKSDVELRQPMVKIFSENRLSFWKNRMREVKDKQTECQSVESVTKILDTLKFTLENSIYEPVT